MIFNPALKAKCDVIVSRYPVSQAAVIPVLHLVQAQEGFLSPQTQQEVADYLKIPVSKVQEVVSFYTMFTTEPRGRNHLMVCRTLSCALGGCQGVMEAVEKKLGVGPKQVTPDGKELILLLQRFKDDPEMARQISDVERALSQATVGDTSGPVLQERLSRTVLPQLETLNLSRRRVRQILHEHVPPRLLEARQRLSRQLAQLVFQLRRLKFYILLHNKRTRTRKLVGIKIFNYRRARNRPMSQQRIFNLNRRHPSTTRFETIVAASHVIPVSITVVAI